MPGLFVEAVDIAIDTVLLDDENFVARGEKVLDFRGREAREKLQTHFEGFRRRRGSSGHGVAIAVIRLR